MKSTAFSKKKIKGIKKTGCFPGEKEKKDDYVKIRVGLVKCEEIGSPVLIFEYECDRRMPVVIKLTCPSTCVALSAVASIITYSQ